MPQRFDQTELQMIKIIAQLFGTVTAVIRAPIKSGDLSPHSKWRSRPQATIALRLWAKVILAFDKSLTRDQPCLWLAFA